jgi:hypothetical protein
MRTKTIIAICVSLLLISVSTTAQAKKEYFSLSSSLVKEDKNYGVINIVADKKTVLLGTVMAYGENVKGLTIRINNGFPFKLAPAENGFVLNYIGNGLNIVLQPGDKVTIEFISSGKNTGSRQLYAAGEIIE